MGSKQPAKTTQTNEVKLSPEQQKIAAMAQPFAQQYASQTLTAPNMSVLGFNPQEITGQNMALGAADGAIQNQVTQAANTNSWLMDPNILNPATNPFLQMQGDAVVRQGQDQFLEGILPGLRHGSVTTGGVYGGGNTRQGIAAGVGAGKVSQGVSDALASLYGGAYQQGLSTLGAATDRSGQIAKNLLLPSSIHSAVGAQTRELEQNQANAAGQMDWFTQNLPLLQAQNLYGLMNAMPGGQGVSTVTGAQAPSGGISGALGGAMSGAALGSMIPGLGTGIGALLGGAGGWFA